MKKRLVKLNESDLMGLINKVKNQINEAAPEPVIAGSRTAKVMFENEGEYKLTQNTIEAIKDFVGPVLKFSKGTIETFYKNRRFKLPKFIEIGASTTSGGDPSANDKVAQQRIASVKSVVESMMRGFGYNDEMIRQFLTTNSNYDYTPTKLDANLYDRTRVKPLDKERFVYIKINLLDTEGLDASRMDNVEDALRIARGMNFNPDEEGIAQAICRLQTYSDITDLNNELRDFGGLQAFINQTITWGYTTYDDDSVERNKIMACLNNASKRSVGGRKIATIVGDNITILLENNKKKTVKLTESQLIEVIRRAVTKK